MSTITRAEVITPALPAEEFHLPEAGGTVRVVGLLLKDRLAMLEAAKALADELDFVPSVLERTVVLDDGEPLYGLGGWRVFQSAHPERAGELFAVAMRLNGHNAQESKKN